MPGKRNPFQGIGEGIIKVTCETAWANVEITGTGAHASNALKRAGWDAKTPMAAAMMTVDNSGIKGTEWILRGSLGDVVVPLQRVQEDKLMKATLNLNDLSKVKFPTVTNPTGGGPNHSVWMDGADVTTSLTFGGTSLTEESAIQGGIKFFISCHPSFGNKIRPKQRDLQAQHFSIKHILWHFYT